MAEQFEEIAELSPPYTTDIGAYADNLKVSISGPPPLERGQVTSPSAHTVDLCGLGVDTSGQGTASRPTLSPLGAATPKESNDALAPADVAAAAQLAGIPISTRPIISRDNNIVIFYEHKLTKRIHVKIQAAGDRLQVIDRPATPDDRHRYSRQWHYFETSTDQVKNGGTPLITLFKQQPTIVSGLEAQNIPTVEHLSNLSDIGIEAIASLGGVELVQRANRFLEQRPVMERDQKIAEQAKEIEALRAQISELTVQANRRRRMRPKTDEAYPPEDESR